MADTATIKPGTSVNLAQVLPATIERYELKYLISADLIEPITQFVQAYCEYDNHSIAAPDRFYPVNSLYFDTIGYRFLKQRMWGADRRFNMRVRSYGDGRTGPFYAEVKYKTATSVQKFRATLSANQWPNILHPGNQPSADPVDANLRLFLRLAHSYAIEPKIFTRYRRRAFASVMDEYARVTMDIDLRYRPQEHMGMDGYSLSPMSSDLNYDVETIYDDEAHSDASVVLELKTTAGRVPVWMIELIRRFQLKQTGFSKYMNSSIYANVDNGLRYMNSDRCGRGSTSWGLQNPVFG